MAADVNRSPVEYDMAVVRGFALWGVVGMTVGLLAALQLAWPELNWGPYLHFGRIRPLHTNAVIFGFTLGVVFAGSYYGIQRLCRVRMFSDTLSRLNLWGWNAIIVVAAVTLLAGKSTAKEYAELEWPIDIASAPVLQRWASMSFLALTLPVSILIAAILLALVLREVRRGSFDDLEGPAQRMFFDDDEVPEQPGEGRHPDPDPSAPS